MSTVQALAEQDWHAQAVPWDERVLVHFILFFREALQISIHDTISPSIEESLSSATGPVFDNLTRFLWSRANSPKLLRVREVLFSLSPRARLAALRAECEEASSTRAELRKLITNSSSGEPVPYARLRQHRHKQGNPRRYTCIAGSVSCDSARVEVVANERRRAWSNFGCVKNVSEGEEDADDCFHCQKALAAGRRAEKLHTLMQRQKSLQVSGKRKRVYVDYGAMQNDNDTDGTEDSTTQDDFPSSHVSSDVDYASGNSDREDQVENVDDDDDEDWERPRDDEREARRLRRSREAELRGADQMNEKKLKNDAKMKALEDISRRRSVRRTAAAFAFDA